MKKLVKSMATLLMVAGVVGFMGCKQPTGGDENTTVEPEAKPLQEGVTKLPVGTKGTFGPSKNEGEYVEFGYWPQSKKADSVKLGTKITNVNGWSCLTGTDGAYYVEVKAAPYYKKGYENDSEIPYTIYKFDDKTNVEKDKIYYFKLEPIVWHVLTDNYSGKKLLLAEKALVAHRYHESSNNYETSEIRAYLNGLETFEGNGFLQKAFTTAEIAEIADTVLDNSAESTFGSSETGTTNNFACGNTIDKIFLLSQKEVTTADFGFDVNNDKCDDKKERKSTDYARATGIYVSKVYYTSHWWLRSPYHEVGNDARYVSSIGKTDNTDDFGERSVDRSMQGVVPALSM